MSRRLLLAVVTGGSVLIVGVTVAGYLAGTSAAASEADAVSAREQAAGAAFALANPEAMSSGIGRGLAAGVGAGEEQALDEGGARGVVDGHQAAEREGGAEPSARLSGGDLNPAPPLAGSGGVLVVGDSLEVATSPYLEQYLPGVELTVSAEVGYNSYQIHDLLAKSFDPSDSVVVFDAGTNDSPTSPEILAGNLEAVGHEVGDRCMVVPTIHGPTVGGVDSSGLNRVVAEFAASRPGTQTPDWAEAAATRPELMSADDIHPIAAGADLRAQLIAQGITACLGAGAGSQATPPQNLPLGPSATGD